MTSGFQIHKLGVVSAWFPQITIFSVVSYFENSSIASIYFCDCVGGACAIAYVWRSENNCRSRLFPSTVWVLQMEGK